MYGACRGQKEGPKDRTHVNMPELVIDHRKFLEASHLTVLGVEEELAEP